jgi:hypothetical protein
MQGISLKAILVGAAIDLIMSFGMAIVIAFCIGLFVYGVHQPGHKLDAAAIRHVMHDDLYLSATTALGGFLTIFAGFITGWIAPSQKVKNALAMSFLSVVISLVLLPFMGEYSPWYVLAGIFVTIGCGTLGGLFSQLILGR